MIQETNVVQLIRYFQWITVSPVIGRKIEDKRIDVNDRMDTTELHVYSALRWTNNIHFQIFELKNNQKPFPFPEEMFLPGQFSK